MDSAVFEDLLVTATTSPDKKTLEKLLDQLKTAGNPIPAPVVEQLNLLWEAWSGEELDDAQGAFCIGLAALPMADSPVFRKLLAQAVKAVLPNYLSRPPIMKALGVRDDAVSLSDFAARLHRLRVLKNGLILFLPAASRWGIVGSLDSIGSLAVNAWGATGGSAAVPLDIVLREAVLLIPGPELGKLVDGSRGIVSSADFRNIVERKAIVPVPGDVMKQMAQSGCARALDRAAFEKYWENKVGNQSGSAARRSCNGRSLKEVDLLLVAEGGEEADAFTEEDVAGFNSFFSNLKSDTAAREVNLLASIVARLQPRSNPEQLREMLIPLRAKAPFWPEKPISTPLAPMSVWGELPARELELLAQVTGSIFTEEYLAECAMRVPLKSLNAICADILDETLYDLFREQKYCTSDFLLWIWKNRKKRDCTELLQLVNVDNVLRALSQDNLPKAWGAAQRELRTLLLNNSDFQKQLIHEAADDVMMFAAALQGALFLSSGERQSLMVKLARISPLLRDHLENGAGLRILKAGIGKVDTDAPTGDEPNYTSVKSHKRLIKELDDIVNVHIPENREALKVARAHGDFRENSEFDAAKERRNFLGRRRTELERELARIQPINMGSVRVENSAVIGSEIELKYDDGEVEVYQLLGAWDGDPERKFLAYRTRLGQAVLHRAVGESIEVPDGRKCILSAVRPLSEAVVAELDV
ncbi:Transcription elongation factor GreA [bioreactor metagenome]|uniref:Transcription elongation factor GreA n=1 Tax=bioreactor metagenome TaxID=1076179 RepID=A0A644ZJC0_9ZZZZ